MAGVDKGEFRCWVRTAKKQVTIANVVVGERYTQAEAGLLWRKRRRGSYTSAEIRVDAIERVTNVPLLQCPNV